MKKYSHLIVWVIGIFPIKGYAQQLDTLHKKNISVTQHDTARKHAPQTPVKPVPFNQLTNRRTKAIPLSFNKDTITIDTLSIIPQSLLVKTRNGQVLDTIYYKLNPAESIIILNNAALKKNGIRADTIYCTYRVFPLLFTQIHSHKNSNTIHPSTYGQQQAYIYQAEQTGNSNDPFDLGTLNKSGSISRGVTIGNTQNLSLNSTLNLQLNGKLSNNVNVLVSATDNSLPIQPEGNTATLQDFDKVFIKLYNNNTALTAGDFEVASPEGYFMKYYKKAEGGLFSTRFMVTPAKDSSKAGYLKVTGVGAISKGKFASDQVNAIDGNSGPYLLTGANNETYIVVLSGTEQVFLDGVLMQRGQNNDYTIDYNNAQITFTPKHIILQTTRIIVEFQYTDNAYLSSLFTTGLEYHKESLNLHFNTYSEQDAKTQQLEQTLSPQQEQFLSAIGNNIQNAFVPGVATVAWNNTLVLYKKIDTVNTSLGFNDSIYVYSTDSTKAMYQLSFTQVAQGQGDYVQTPSAANGKVFKWVAPVAGVHQGNYVPELLLITPKQKQMATFGGDYKISPHSSIMVETAVTNNNVNTFSSLDKGQDAGFAGTFNFHNVTFLQDSIQHKKDSWRLTTDAGYEGVTQYFSPIDRYRPVEFDRDWNRTSDSIFAGQNIFNASFQLGNTKNLFGYDFKAFLEGGNYNATRQTAVVKIKEKKLSIDANGALLNTKTVENTSNYYKEFATVSYKISKWVAGAGEGTENDIFRSRRTDSIISTSSTVFEQSSTFKYYQWNTFIRSADTAKASYGINYLERTDFGPQDDEMVKSLFSRNISFDVNLLKNPKSRFKANVTYHVLTVFDSAIAQGQKPANALVGQAQYDLNAAHGLIYSSTYYQAGSGMQPVESFVYVQVAQGQGVYAWTDFNHDGIKELNEFYIAPFPDEADYIRVYTPTNQFIRTYTSGITETFNLRPAAIWNDKKDIRSLIARFSEQLAFHTDEKTTSNNIFQDYNPLIQHPNDTNTLGLNTSLRNTIFFNQLNPKYGADYSFNDVITKTILQETGAQGRENKYNELHGRFNLTTRWMLEDDEKFGNDIGTSNYFLSNNFNILYYISQPKLTYQPTTGFRTSLIYTFTDKINSNEVGGGQSFQESYGAELKYNVLNKGSLLANFNYINITFNESPDSPLGLEMLQGLNKGSNFTWGLTYQCNISHNIQMNISYTGRSSEGSNIVNTGTAQVRAFF